MWSPMHVVNLGVGGIGHRTCCGDYAQRVVEAQAAQSAYNFGPNNLNSDKVCAIDFGLFRRVAAIWPSTQIGFLEIPPRGPRFLDCNDSRMQLNATARQVPGVKAINVDDPITCGWQEPCTNYLHECAFHRRGVPSDT